MRGGLRFLVLLSVVVFIHGHASDSIGERKVDLLDGASSQLAMLFAKPANVLLVVRTEEDIKDAFRSITLIESFHSQERPDWLIMAILPKSILEKRLVSRVLDEQFKSEFTRSRIATLTTNEYSRYFRESPSIVIEDDRHLFIADDHEGYLSVARMARDLNRQR